MAAILRQPRRQATWLQLDAYRFLVVGGVDFAGGLPGGELIDTLANASTPIPGAPRGIGAVLCQLTNKTILGIDGRYRQGRGLMVMQPFSRRFTFVQQLPVFAAGATARPNGTAEIAGLGRGQVLFWTFTPPRALGGLAVARTPTVVLPSFTMVYRGVTWTFTYSGIRGFVVQGK